MGATIHAGGGPPSPSPTGTELAVMRIGNAEVFIAPSETAVTIAPKATPHTVSPSPEKSFDQAVTVIQECVRVVGGKIKEVGETLTPEELTLEFTVTFEVSGKVTPIPILVTGETKVNTGLKVTAKWHPKAAAASGSERDGGAATA
jgi:hypothetical protein